MIKLYIPNISSGAVGGGWTFRNNLINGLQGKVSFVDDIDSCDIFFISGITMIDKSDIFEAKRQGKKIVLRVDNVPKKSRNKRSSPHERLKEFGQMSDWIVFQSKWSKKYTSPLFDDIGSKSSIIYNGVDKKVFYSDEGQRNNNRYLFAYHGNSELKGFWQAHYYFQMLARGNNKAEFWFIYDFGRGLEELKDSNFDFWNGENFKYLDKANTPHEMASIMRKCKYLIFPSFMDAAPNTILEARSCGLEVINTVSEFEGGSKEMLELKDISLERMSDEYLELFKSLL